MIQIVRVSLGALDRVQEQLDLREGAPLVGLGFQREVPGGRRWREERSNDYESFWRPGLCATVDLFFI